MNKWGWFFAQRLSIFQKKQAYSHFDILLLFKMLFFIVKSLPSSPKGFLSYKSIKIRYIWSKIWWLISESPLTFKQKLTCTLNIFLSTSKSDSFVLQVPEKLLTKLLTLAEGREVNTLCLLVSIIKVVKAKHPF